MRERLFKEMIFCGTPEVYFQGLGKLHAQVNRALSFISGLQQPPHSTSETQARMDEYERELGWKEVMVCVQDIVCALLGPDYYIEKKLTDEQLEKTVAEGMARETAKDVDEQLGISIAEIARQKNHAKDPYSIYAYHKCSHNRCDERAEYIACDGFGRTLLVCEKHYSQEATCDEDFK